MAQSTVNRQATEAIGELEGTATAATAKQEKPIEASARDAKQLQKPSHIWNMLLSWSDQDVCNMFSCFDEISRCQITEPTRKVVRLQKKKRGLLCQKKDAFFFLHDNSNSDIVSSNLRHADYVFTALSILDRFAVFIFTSSKSVRVAMYFDLSTIVQPFYQGSILLGEDSLFVFKYCPNMERSHPNNLAEMEQQVDKFMFEFDRLMALRCKQYKENTPYHMRGWIQTKGEDEFKTVHYPSKFLWKKYRGVDLLNSKELADTLKSTEIAKFGQCKWTKATGENVGYCSPDQFPPKKPLCNIRNNLLRPSRSVASIGYIKKLNIQSKNYLISKNEKFQTYLIHSAFVLIFCLLVCYFGIELNCTTLFYCILSMCHCNLSVQTNQKI
ncbi:hypothetical protein RFI_16057 [Reticulomyxa filosa]|uniref:Uncharacterized protein n=1 Tax=Reticulomyxa filosa TaxID=46433 RepID=X6N761_RETFI|nr:hypothetical protein RFI_16057 [Reticulomyxa filosa]|eukprot:ETO21147.1 hypothetical protein RFI_16057 [Reticulomyxa filosa]